MTSATEGGARMTRCDRYPAAPGTGRGRAVIWLIAASRLTGGCAMAAQLKAVEPTALTQQLVMRSLERAVAQLDLDRVRGRRVALEVFAQAGNPALTRALVASWLVEHGVHVTTDAPDLTMHVLISALGSDLGETLIGIPAFQAPLVGMPVPEIALFKWVRNRGLSEMRLYTFDAKTGAFVDKGRAVEGRSKRDDFTVLLIVRFTVTDVDERVE